MSEGEAGTDDTAGEADGLRKIIHVDMDAFFASVEQRDNPELRGKPVAVGGSSGRGVVAAASYEARRFGVRSAMPSVTAKRLCPDLIFCKSRFDVYREVSQQIRAIFRHHTDLVEPLSLDEAYLDVTEDKLGIGSATRIAELIRQEIRAKTRLTASAGVSYNKFLAKIASDQNKPDGLCVIRPGEGARFVAELPIRRFHGVGPKGAEKMARLGIETGGDLAARDIAWLRAHFGSFAEYLFRAARGIDLRPVRSSRIRKSVGGERTFSRDLSSGGELRETLEDIIDIVWTSIERAEARGRTVTLKLKYTDFQIFSRAKTVDVAIAEKAQFAALARALLEEVLPLPMPIRLMGLTLSKLEQQGGETQSARPDAQLSLL
ncbi:MULTISPECIES: DNA polymerase IV [unclassified Erythrobacter]|jgi:DNA polymerase-4|uniref:DNA polymerase IV n=1 Tax=unclassified Erythrobacter TaxID=2633097 RepID=UPI0007B7C149|nr:MULTISPECIES: DNA polymerase IV [unclassified Erythrobacter]KZY93024.1 DNA polymerase IV [Erythrobacter sp. HI0074]KZZ08041.1 DNA polymerase IV [Erythrobacter sp. HI0077]MBN91181.1 DNA polymerase IV [Erythrobacteraceae bacterium]HBQ54995.1 DNA polymerase IV [Erythrobacter sp.]|tara:strand:+ start:530 stop:1657 length:1128 start_codon:yes stop_codon:yes gene_type:complete